MTANFFEFLGVPALRGQTFTSADAAGPCKVVLTYRFWQTAFGGLNTAVGSPIRLDAQVCTVTGIMPPGFEWGARMEPVLYDLHEEFTWMTGRNLRLSLYVFFGAVSFVLLICCVNVANLLLGRGVSREREMAIRAALGSGRTRLLRQLLTESLLLSVCACATGTALAAAIVHYFQRARPIELPPGVTLELSAPVLGFAALLSVMTCLLFGLVPALRVSRADLQRVLKSGGSRSTSQGARQQRFGKRLIIAEVTLTAVLLTGAGLLIQTVQRFASAPLGFEPNGLVTTSVSLPPTGYAAPDRRRAFFERLEANLAAHAGIASLAFSSSRPIDGGGVVNVIMVEGHPEPRIDHPADTFGHTVSPNYFDVLQVPLKTGRFFDRSDSGASEPTVIINEALAREYLPGENAIGKHIRIFDESERDAPWLRIVGVVGNEKRTTVYQEMAWSDPPVMYRPLAQDPLMTVNVIARLGTTAGRSKLASDVQLSIAALDPNVPADPLLPVTDLELRATAYPRFRATLLAGFAVLGLLLATVGLFGVLSHSVAQGRQEIGVRMALGAENSAVVLMILKEGVLLTGFGILIGIAVSWGLARYLSALLYGVRPDPLLFAATALVWLPAGFIAMYLPVRRATQVDPVVALRYE